MAMACVEGYLMQRLNDRTRSQEPTDPPAEGPSTPVEIATHHSISQEKDDPANVMRLSAAPDRRSY